VKVIAAPALFVRKSRREIELAEFSGVLSFMYFLGLFKSVYANQ